MSVVHVRKRDPDIVPNQPLLTQRLGAMLGVKPARGEILLSDVDANSKRALLNKPHGNLPD